MIERILQWLGFSSPTLGGVARSSLWPHTKREFAKTHPKVCPICGSGRVQLHHLQSFASKPELENDLSNLIWLCQGFGTKNHHLEWGHLGNFQSLNEHLEEWIALYKSRPKWNGKEWVYQQDFSIAHHE